MTRVPLDPSELQAEFKVYVVTIFCERELAETLAKLPMFKDQVDRDPSRRSFEFSTHRCPPKRYFNVPRGLFPSQDEVWQADQQSQLLAQKQALELIAMPGIRLVNVSWELRKAAGTRFTRGQRISGCTARLRSVADRWLPGEPTERALAIQRGEE